MVGEASGRMQKADCRDEIALPAAMLAWLKYRKQRTRNSRKRFLVFFCSLFVKARVVYRLRLKPVQNAYTASDRAFWARSLLFDRLYKDKSPMRVSRTREKACK